MYPKPKISVVAFSGAFFSCINRILNLKTVLMQLKHTTMIAKYPSQVKLVQLLEISRHFAWETSNEKVCFYFHKVLHLQIKALLENTVLQLVNASLQITCVSNFNPKSSLNNATCLF